MCDYIPSDPVLVEFHDPIKCPREQIFVSGILTEAGEIIGGVVTRPACWNEATLKVNDGEAKTTRPIDAT